MARIDRWYTVQVVGGKRRKVRTAQYGKGLQWEARWRDSAGVQRKKRFQYADDADDWLAEQRMSPKAQAAKTTLADLWDPWIAGKDALKPKTRAGYESSWHTHIEPELGARLVSTLTAREIRDWYRRIGSTDARRCALVVIKGMLKLAVEDGMLPANPAANLSGGQSVKRRVESLEPDQVDALAKACVEVGIEAEFWTLLAVGLRLGEMASLAPRNVAKAGSGYVLHIERTVQRIGGQTIYGSPKSGHPRDVPCPAWVAERFRTSGPLCLPGSEGEPWVSETWRTPWEQARRAAGLPELHTHDLRHVFAARQIEAGTDFKTLQAVMGHSKLSITLDLYGSMARPDLSKVADITGRS
ncbi:site-specific integrase [Propionimicrobium sp. PCR01-08-3]|uniref:tyrosine-type recombinase/integrase n=1 Tax=Propionimicrobium sp. PCR01-08-3 TaxID=3052086 RepID=UPI00255C8DE5|nr:site-specific integrase [Propionimicrobium sp. PCR01-08-3]WIY84297.1 tyrosine-type recombinase/integrase [Propionimicrobium sp. PCR01-08-3]